MSRNVIQVHNNQLSYKTFFLIQSICRFTFFTNVKMCSSSIIIVNIELAGRSPTIANTDRHS